MLELLIVVARALPLALRGHRELVLENLALRQQLTAMKRSANRPRLERGDRLFWIALARVWQNWRTALVVVQPDTVVRWHRDWLRRRWTRRSKRRPCGRPPLDQQIRVLVRDMATANPLWGAPRIHGELRTLGVDVSERTVSRLLGRYPRPSSQTWKTFLTNHLASAASMDFFTVPTLTGRVLFVLIVLAHHRRRIVHLNITDHPTAAWSAQQVVNAFPDDTAPRWIHRDRDRIHGDVFQRQLASMGIAGVVSAPASPWQNPYAERLIGSVRRECLNHVIVLGERHPRRLLSAYLLYYHGARTHLSLEKDAPTRRRPRAGGRSRGGVGGSGWTSPSLRTPRSLNLSVDQRVCVDMSTSLDPRPRVRRRSIPANRVRHNCSGDVAVCRNGFTPAAHSRCPPDSILANDRRPEDTGQLLHNLLHDPGHGRLARGIISNFFDLT